MEEDCRLICLALAESLDHVRCAMKIGDWTSARDRLKGCLQHGTTYMWCSDNTHKKNEFVDVVNMLIGGGRHAAILMDYNLSSEFYLKTLAVVDSVGLNGKNEVSYICQAIKHHVENLFHCQQFEVIVAFMKFAWRHYLEGVECEEVSYLLCDIHMKLGVEYVTKTMATSAKEQLQLADKHFQNVPSLAGTITEAKLKSSLGSCLLLSNELTDSISLLSMANNMWKRLNWPLVELECIISTLKNYILAQLQLVKTKKECHIYIDVKDDLVQLHHIAYKLLQSMIVADTFTSLGMNAFHTENETRAVIYFRQALDLYKQAGHSKQYTDEILRLLQFVGVACYNTREFETACQVYHERLNLLEATQSIDMNKLSQIADCHASLGFTYSRLRNFDNMLLYYERALGAESHLTAEDLQLIETNIGSLYHVKAVKLGKENLAKESAQYIAMAENAFTKALRYSWKSFPFINYGYYLYFQGRYDQSVAFLQQGYLNSVLDKDTVEFDHTEDLILTNDLRQELEDRDFIRVPAVIVSLYLKCLAQQKKGNSREAR